MKEDLKRHQTACSNCLQLATHKQNQVVPYAEEHVDLHGPFQSYGENKFVTVLTDESTKITI